MAFPLLLLLLSASVDDVWGAVAPDVWSDQAAAENDEYLPARPREHPRSAARKPLQPHSLRFAASASIIPAATSSPNLYAAAYPSPALLYLLMSLQC
jgi:hypothetical protein